MKTGRVDHGWCITQNNPHMEIYCLVHGMVHYNDYQKYKIENDRATIIKGNDRKMLNGARQNMVICNLWINLFKKMQCLIVKPSFVC